MYIVDCRFDPCLRRDKDFRFCLESIGMAKEKRKGILNAGLKALLAGVEASPWIKIPATFVSELAALPGDKQKELGGLSQQEFNNWLEESGVATAEAAEEIKDIVKGLDVKVDVLLKARKEEQAEGTRVVHNLPYRSIGGLFTGREEILEELGAQVGGDKATAITQAIAGLGGIGKSRLAVEFGWWGFNNEKFGHVFFVSSETPKLINTSLAQLATGVLEIAGGDSKEADARKTALAWLTQNDGWLMIIDNADSEDAAEMVEKLLPQLSRGQVIITSRYKRWSNAVQLRKLKLLAKEEAKGFLLERTRETRIQTDSDEELAGKLAAELGYLPLALEQAGAYIAHNGCSMAEYLQEWEDEREKVLEWYVEREMQYPASVATTYERTFERLSVGARALLRLSALLAPEKIPTEMFEKGSETAGEAMGLLDKKKGGRGKKFKCKEAVGELAAYSMVTREENGFTVHRIVQEVVRGRIEEGEKRDWIEKALRIVNGYAPGESGDVRTWPVWDLIRPHAERIAEAADKAEITEPTTRLMGELDCYLSAKGLYAQAEYFSRRALAIDEVSFGPEHPDVAIRLNNLAQLLQATNRLDEAEPMMRRAVKVFEDSLGAGHPWTQTVKVNLEGLLKEKGE